MRRGIKQNHNIEASGNTLSVVDKVFLLIGYQAKRCRHFYLMKMIIRCLVYISSAQTPTF